MDNSNDIVKINKSAPLLIRFEPSLKRELERRAKQEGMSASAIVRMAVRAFIAPKERKRA